MRRARIANSSSSMRWYLIHGARLGLNWFLFRCDGWYK